MMLPDGLFLAILFTHVSLKVFNTPGFRLQAQLSCDFVGHVLRGFQVNKCLIAWNIKTLEEVIADQKSDLFAECDWSTVIIRIAAVLGIFLFHLGCDLPQMTSQIKIPAVVRVHKQERLMPTTSLYDGGMTVLFEFQL